MGSVKGNLQFLKRLDLYQREVPFQIFMPIPEDAEDPRPDNLEFEAKEHLIEDIRDTNENFTLDSHGFEHLTCPPSWVPTSTSTRQDVEAFYLPDVENLIKTHVEDVDEIFFFDWRLRDADRTTTDVEVLDLNDPTARIRPATHVHIDQSPASVVHRTKLQLADHAEYLLQGRVRIINVWRPLDHTVLDYPLGVCDGKSVDDKDMLECDVVRRRFIGGTVYLCYNENQKWHYLSNQTCDEVLLLKMFDSESSVVRACPHASFLHPSATLDTPKRKSIEVRALVFTYPDRPGLETLTANAV